MRAPHVMIPPQTSAARVGLLLAATGLWTAPAAAASCAATAVGVHFGTYDPFDPAPLESVGNINVSCDSTATFTISLSQGTGTYAARMMTNGVRQMEYNLYSDPARVVIWGDGSSASSTVSATASAGDFAVYGRAPARQNLPVGSYSDTIVVTIIY